MEPKGEICRGMQGTIQEGEEIINLIDDPELMDATIVMVVQRVGHYKIAGYGTAAAYAQELGYQETAQELVAINAKEYEADSILTELAESRINEEADSDSSRSAYV